jgi:LEA14-like dessication related protein
MSANVVLPALTAAALLLLTACSSLPVKTQSPRVTLIGLSLLSVDLLEQRYQVRLRIKNPNAFELPVRGMDFNLELNGKTFADGVSSQALDVPAYGESVVALEVSSSLLQVFRQLQSLDESASPGIRYRIEGSVALNNYRRLPFEYSGEIRAPESPPAGSQHKI